LVFNKLSGSPYTNYPVWSQRRFAFAEVFSTSVDIPQLAFTRIIYNQCLLVLLGYSLGRVPPRAVSIKFG